ACRLVAWGGVERRGAAALAAPSSGPSTRGQLTTRGASLITRPQACGRVRGHVLEIRSLAPRVARTASGAPSAAAPRRGSDRKPERIQPGLSLRVLCVD